MIHTTISVYPAVVFELDSMARKNKCSRNTIVQKLAQLALKNQQGTILTKRCVRYQKMYPEKLIRVHIFLPVDLYEQCLDLRKFSKRSLSLIIAEAVTQYRDILKSTDNYQLVYTMKCNFSKNARQYITLTKMEKKRITMNPG